MHTSVVLHDPRELLRLGSLVRENEIAKLESQGVILLPCEEPYLTSRQALPYFYRSFGEDQVLLKLDAPTRCCGMALEHDSDFPHLHWMACLAAAGPNPRASVSLTADAGRGYFAAGSLEGSGRTVLEPTELALPGDWAVIGGRARLTLGMGNIAGFSMNALGNDVSILWCALSQCVEPRHMKCLDR